MQAAVGTPWGSDKIVLSLSYLPLWWAYKWESQSSLLKNWTWKSYSSKLEECRTL